MTLTMKLTADGEMVVIDVPLAAQAVVPVYTRDGRRFEASPRGIGDAACTAAKQHAMEYVAEHCQEFEELRAQFPLASTARADVERVVEHIGKAKAKEIVELAFTTAKGTMWGNSKQALDALGSLVGGPARPKGCFPILEAAQVGRPPGQQELDLHLTLDLLKRFIRQTG